MKLLVVLISCLAIIDTVAVAQQSDRLSNDYTAALSVYHSLLKPETGLYRGNEYLNYAHTILDGSPFFDPVPFDTGSVCYHDIVYRNVPIAYDVVKDEVVIYDAHRLHIISLIKKEVSRFTASGYAFINITKDSAGAARLRSGFYQVLYEGNIKMLRKEMRSVQERSATRPTMDRYTTSSTEYFVVKNGIYHSVGGKSGLFSVLQDKQKELQQFARKKRLKFRKNKASDFAQATAYYDSLTR